MVGKRLIAVVQVEDVQILARQAAGLSRQVAPESDQVAIHLNDSFEFASSARLKSMSVGVLEAEGASLQHLLSLKDHRNSR